MKDMWGDTIWYYVYGVFRRNVCLYVGATGDPCSRERTHKRRFGKRSELRILKRVLSPSRVFELEQEFIRKYARLGQARFNKNGRTKMHVTAPMIRGTGE